MNHNAISVPVSCYQLRCGKCKILESYLKMVALISLYINRRYSCRVHDCDCLHEGTCTQTWTVQVSLCVHSLPKQMDSPPLSKYGEELITFICVQKGHIHTPNCLYCTMRERWQWWWYCSWMITWFVKTTFNVRLELLFPESCSNLLLKPKCLVNENQIISQLGLYSLHPWNSKVMNEHLLFNPG